jgi:hypothetical protein
MIQPLALALMLEQSECICGETVYFNVTMVNAAGDTLKQVPTFDSHNQSLRLVVETLGGQTTADALSAEERDGLHTHGPENKKTVSLKPGDKLALRDDLLTWFGELPPGKYQVTAVYSADFFEARSQPVPLRILPAAPVALSTPRHGQRTSDAPLAAGWGHRHDSEVLLFYQQQSPALPRNLRHGIRVAKVNEPVELWASTLANAGTSKGSLLWLDRRSRLYFAPADVLQPRISPAVEIKTPFAGRPLDPPLSTPDHLFVVLCDSKKERVAALQVDGTGNCQTAELDLGKAKPLGAYTCFWEYEARLHLVWAKPQGRELQYARLPMSDIAGGFATRSIAMLDDPVVGLDAYLDVDAPFSQQSYFKEGLKEEKKEELAELPPPRLMLWCVTEGQNKISCFRVSAANGQIQPVVSFPIQQTGSLKVVASTVTFRHELVLLLVDARGRLFCASTSRKSLQPLLEVTNREISLNQFPGLVPASDAALEPWVYLRFEDGKSSIKYIHLEPGDEQDPVERETSHQTGANVPDR